MADPGARRLFVSVVRLRCGISADPGALRDRNLTISPRSVGRRGRPKPRLLSGGYVAADRPELASSSAALSVAGTCESQHAAIRKVHLSSVFLVRIPESR